MLIGNWKPQLILRILFCLPLLCYVQASSGTTNLNLTEICSDNQLYFCCLENLSSVISEQLIIKNATQPYLKELIIKNSRFLRLPHEIFELTPKLEIFMMYSCGLNRIFPSDFNSTNSLRTLMLQMNRIGELPENAFSAAVNLVELHLGYNQIHLVHRRAFDGLVNLKYLTLQQNAIRELSFDLFADLVNLEHIDLSHNQIQVINGDTFRLNTRLRTVLLNDNRFTVFEPSALAHLPHIRLLDVSNNDIIALQVQSVDTLNVHNNILQTLEVNGSLISLHAGNNRLSSLKIADKLSVREAFLHANLFTRLSSLTGMLNLQRLDLSKNTIESLSTSDSPVYLQFPSLTVLNLAHNNLNELNPDVFILLQKLISLDLSYNRIYNLQSKLLEPLISLEKFSLQGNRLHAFDYEHFHRTHRNLSEFCAANNNWEPHFHNRMLSFFTKNQIFPCRFEGIHHTTNAPSSSSASHSALHDDIAIQPSSDHQHHHQQHDEIHSIWTLKDIFAVVTLIAVIIILILMARQIFYSDGGFQRTFQCFRVNRQQHGQRLSEPEDDSEL